MTTSVAARVGVCVCGVDVICHFDDRNARVSCAEARDRQLRFGDRVPDDPQPVARVLERVAHA